MSDNYRSEFSRDLGGFGILAAFIIVIIVVAGTAYSSGIQSERRHLTPIKYSGYAKRNIERICVGKEDLALFECVYEEIASSQDTARAEQDLDAQQGMKFWALWMFFATLFTATITGIGVWYVRLTLQKNSELLIETAKATEAMLNANKIARTSSEQQLRAYISIGTLQSEDIYTRGIEYRTVTMPLKNSGPTPVKNWKIYWAWTIDSNEVKESFFEDTLSKHKQFSRHSDTEYSHSFGPNDTKLFPMAMRIKDDWLSKIMRKEYSLYILGKIVYIDVFDKERETEFFYRLNRDNSPIIFGQMPMHNQMT